MDPKQEGSGTLDLVDKAYAAIEKLDFLIAVMVWGGEGMSEALDGGNATQGLAQIMQEVRDTMRRYLDYESNKRMERAKTRAVAH